MTARGRHLGAERVPEDRGMRPAWRHAAIPEGCYGAFVVDRMSPQQMASLTRGEYFGTVVDYARQFPDMPAITRVLERIDGERLRLWMTDGPQEVAMMAGLARGHRGRVLVTGLGMGIVQQRLLERPDVVGVTTVEAHPDVVRLHERAAWFADPRHDVVIADVDDVLAPLVAGGEYDGYVLDHWDSVGDRLVEKVVFLRLLADRGQTDRRVSMWGFWWEVEQTAASDDPDTAALLAEVQRCRRCGRILQRPGDPDGEFAVAPAADGAHCEACADLPAAVHPGAAP